MSCGLRKRHEKYHKVLKIVFHENICVDYYNRGLQENGRGKIIAAKNLLSCFDSQMDSSNIPADINHDMMMLEAEEQNDDNTHDVLAQDVKANEGLRAEMGAGGPGQRRW